MADHTTSRTRPRGFLSRELIIKEALALLEEHGPGALSMRRLADRLGVAPTALYTHVRSKADLIDGLIDQVYAGLTLNPDPSGDWTQQLATLSQDVRAPPARPPRRRPLRPPAARPRPPQPAPRRSHLRHPAARGVLRPGRRRHRLCVADLHPGVRRPGSAPGRHRPPDQRRVRPPHVGLLCRPPPRRVPPPRPARPAAGEDLHRRPVPVRHPHLPRRPPSPGMLNTRSARARNHRGML